MSDSFPELPEELPSRGIPHLLNDLGRLIRRYSFEYEMSDAEILGCVEILKAMILDEIAEQFHAHQDEQEETNEEQEPIEEDEDFNIDHE